MCGRFSFVTTLKKIEEDLDTSLETSEELMESYNIAPTQKAYVVTNEQPHLLQSFYWGLIPPWTKSPKLNGQLINARKETILTKPSFRDAGRKKRCWVIADSFYEWQKTGGGRQPYRIMIEGKNTMCMAGIWSTCIIHDREVNTFAILTQNADEQMANIHHRMPVFLPNKAEREQWLGHLSDDALMDFLNEAHNAPLTLTPVSPSVNNVRNNHPHLHDFFTPPPTLF